MNRVATVIFIVLSFSLNTSLFAQEDAEAALRQEAQDLVSRIQAAKAKGLTPNPSLYQTLAHFEKPDPGFSTDGLPPEGIERIPVPDWRYYSIPCVPHDRIIYSVPYRQTVAVGPDSSCQGAPYNEAHFWFLAPETGGYILDMKNTPGDAFMRVWYGDSCCTGFCRTEDDSCGGISLDPKMHEFFVAGQAVFIECGFYSPHPGSSSINLNINAIPTVPNDARQNAQFLLVPVGILGSTWFAGQDTVVSCGGAIDHSAPGVWYYVLGSNRRMTASLCSNVTNYATQIGVYTFSDAGPVCVAGNADAGSTCVGRSQISWCSQLNVHYYILVSGVAQQSGTFWLELSFGAFCNTPGNEGNFCGTPVETEPNNLRTQSDTQFVMRGDTSVYGNIDDGDIDWWKASFSNTSRVSRVSLMDGAGCMQTPAQCVTMQLVDAWGNYHPNDSAKTEWVMPAGTWYFRLFTSSACTTSYRLSTISCAMISPPYDRVSQHIQISANTCCVAPRYRNVGENSCGGAVRQINQAVIARVWPRRQGVFDIIAIGQDPVIGVFNGNVCLGSLDTLHGPMERLRVTVPAGVCTVFCAESNYSCGEMMLDIASDVYLPVELLSYDAASGDRSVTLRWRAGSEYNLDRYEIERDGALVAHVAARNQADGASYSWSDNDLENGNLYRYTLYSRDLDGTRDSLGMVAAAPDLHSGMITEYELYQNYPNPFNPQTRIDYDLPEPGAVNLRVFNLMGQVVATQVNQSQSAGRHTALFDASNLPSGIYIARLTAGGQCFEKKMLLLR